MKYSNTTYTFIGEIILAVDVFEMLGITGLVLHVASIRLLHEGLRQRITLSEMVD